MVTIGMNYMILPGKGEIFEKAFQSVIQVMEEIEGHSQSYLFHDVFDEAHYLIVSEWSSEEDFDGFIKSDRFAKVVNWGQENVLAGRPKHTTYRHE